MAWEIVNNDGTIDEFVTKRAAQSAYGSSPSGSVIRRAPNFTLVEQPPVYRTVAVLDLARLGTENSSAVIVGYDFSHDRYLLFDGRSTRGVRADLVENGFSIPYESARLAGKATRIRLLQTHFESLDGPDEVELRPADVL